MSMTDHEKANTFNLEIWFILHRDVIKNKKIVPHSTYNNYFKSSLVLSNR